MSRTLTIGYRGWVFRWSGGTFIAAWKDNRSGQQVPDDMIGVPASLNRFRATKEDIETIVHRWADQQEKPVAVSSTPAWRTMGFRSRSEMAAFEARPDFPGWSAL